jgi:hypothetical protein
MPKKKAKKKVQVQDCNPKKGESYKDWQKRLRAGKK